MKRQLGLLGSVQYVPLSSAVAGLLRFHHRQVCLGNQSAVPSSNPIFPFTLGERIDSAGQLFSREAQAVEVSEDCDRNIVGLEECVGESLNLL